MSEFERELDKAVEEIADLGRKDDKQLSAVGNYSFYILIFFGALFAASIFGIKFAKTNAGQGVGWFAAFLSGIAFLAAIWSWLDVLREIWRRRR